MTKRLLAIVAVLALILWSAVKLRARGHAVRTPQATAESREPQPVEGPLPVERPSVNGIAGTVRTAQKKPIAGARVCAENAAKPGPGGADACTDSDAAGAYVLTAMTPGRYVVRASAKGFLPAAARGGGAVDVDRDEVASGVDILLEEGGARVAGAVVDAMGGPVPRAAVRVSPRQGSTPPVQVEADDAGRFEAYVAEGPIAVTASSPAYADSRPLFARAPGEDLVLVLAPASTVQGLVVSEVDGRPVPGLTVRAEAVTSGLAAVAPGTSGEDGAFALRGLNPGTYRITAEGPRWRGGVSPVEVGFLANLQGVTVRVKPARRVAGKVERSNGEPCKAGLVMLQPGMDGALTSPIGDDGRVAFEGVLPGRYDVRVQCTGAIVREGPTALEVAGEDVNDLVWKADAGLGFTVTVLDAAGQPVPRAQVSLEMSSSSDARPPQSFMVDDKGRYEFPSNLEAGRYRLSPAGSYEGPAVDLELREGADRPDVTLHVDGAASLLVSVRSRTGDPVDGLTVTARRAEGASSGSAAQSPAEMIAQLQRAGASFTASAQGGGKYRIAPMKEGDYRVQVTNGDGQGLPAEGGGETPIRVAGSVTTTTIVLDRGGSIRGRVVDAQGQPVGDVWVSAQRDERGGAALPAMFAAAAPGRPVLTGVDGNFEIDNLARGARFSVRARQPGGADAALDGVAVGDVVTLTLPAMGGLGGTAVDDQGRPLARFTLGTQQLGAQQAGVAGSAPMSVTTEGGAWKADRVPAGRIRVVAIDDEARTATQEVDVVAGQRAEGLRLVFSKGPHP